ncbi:hypothetical protein BDN70DRAFT_81144 [Pholiota conissans]|uniref:Uncharacterized protein n=1 Tax=Pholiota conissans TaxID=109636 RepID=A0A9P6D6H0_9AGAR|nr:hypothetical protein BDN70DRAFT_81144 [Pholiota conissans]
MQLCLSRRLHYWHTRQADQKKREMQSLREMRCVAIRERLREEGYDSLGKWYWRLDKLPGGNVAAPLTDAAWDKIKFRLLSFFEFQRQDSREKEMIRAFQSRASHLDRTLRLKLEKEPKPWIYAPLPTIVNSDTLATVIGRAVEGADEIQINTEITHLKDRLPKISKTWRAEADEYLLGLLTGPTKSSARADGEALDATPLELATTFFGCHWCTEAVSYPRILMHECLRTRRQDQDADHSDTEGSGFSAQKATTDEGGPDMVHSIPTVNERQVWNKMSSWLGPTWNEAHKFISVDEEFTKSAKAIIQACGENPNTLTAEALNDLNIRVECMRCVPPPGKRGTARSRHVMSWNMAILHDLYMHVDDISAEGWRLVTSETDLARAKEYEDKILRKITVKSYERCRICEATVRSASIDQDSVENPQSHLSKVHKINITTELQDYVYVPLDAPMKAFPRAVII